MGMGQRLGCRKTSIIRSMEIDVAKERILLFAPQIPQKDASGIAWQKKLSAFDAISQVSSFLSRPKDDDFELVYQEYRFEPFWHVVAQAKYVYERTSSYQVAVSGQEVLRVTIDKQTYSNESGHIHLPVLEHCKQIEEEEVFIDGITGKPTHALSRFLSLSPKEVTTDITKHIPKDAIVIPPQTRVSAIMRDSLSKMIKGIQADKILEEEVKVTCVDLYYRPVYAFRYKWKSKGKEAILDVDGVTSEVTTGNRTFQEYVGKVLDPSFLFDVGADAAGMLIPGGSIAVKVAKKYFDTRKKH